MINSGDSTIEWCECCCCYCCDLLDDMLRWDLYALAQSLLLDLPSHFLFRVTGKNYLENLSDYVYPRLQDHV